MSILKDTDGFIKAAKQLKKERLKSAKGKKSDNKVLHEAPRLFDYISKDKMLQLFDNAMDLRIVDNNVKADNIREILGPDFRELGTGTNRIALMKDGYVFKVALDRRGIIDNLAEYKRSAEAPTYLAKCYETNRVVAISEYVNLISADEYRQNKDKIRIILTNLSSKYVMKDLGLTEKNYCNWGYRDDDTIVALDYAYLYPIKGNEDALKCSCGGTIRIDGSFNIYKCDNSECGLKYSALEILNKMNIDAERIDDQSVFSEAGASEEIVEDQFGDQFTNYVKLNSSETPVDGVTKIDPSKPLNTSPLWENAMKIANESGVDSAEIYSELDALTADSEVPDPSDEDITEDEFMELIDKFNEINGGN